MIIFDLDGTLADCEHRRHFVDPVKALKNGFIPAVEHFEGFVLDKDRGNVYHKETNEKWKPDWKSFYEACDKDLVFSPVKSVLIQFCHRDIQIWSGRCESVRKKTEVWLDKNIFDGDFEKFTRIKLKMRPIGDTTPYHILKEMWFNERCSDLIEAKMECRAPIKHDIEFVFEKDPESINMWKRRGVFVFNCNQNGIEF